MNPFRVGDKVCLKDDVLQRHARRVPTRVGYTRAQFTWRDTLRSLKGQVGVVSRLFENSKHINVDFLDTCIGIDYTEVDGVNPNDN